MGMQQWHKARIWLNQNFYRKYISLYCLDTPCCDLKTRSRSSHLVFFLLVGIPQLKLWGSPRGWCVQLFPCIDCCTWVHCHRLIMWVHCHWHTWVHCQTVIIMWVHCHTWVHCHRLSYVSALSQTVIYVSALSLTYMSALWTCKVLCGSFFCAIYINFHSFIHCYRLSYVSALSQTDIHECIVTDCRMWVHCHRLTYMNALSQTVIYVSAL